MMSHEPFKITNEERRWLLRRRSMLSAQFGWACIAGIAMAWTGGAAVVLGAVSGSTGTAWIGVYIAATGTIMAATTGRAWQRRGRTPKENDS